ncbi:MAG: aminotransferase class I/II-fold pyridoxal phosphate-dependent enzyme [Saprospiraceae bacterium]|nr:aminotransferase class I/II-fold pyridoxal phosphate-dependent enzyme [Saprospiraceae bacterium]
MNINSKLPDVGTSIFAKMSLLANEFHAINLAQGFPDFNPPDELLDYLSEGVQLGMNQYAPMPGYVPLRHELSKRLKRDYGFQANQDSEITVTAGATQAIYTIISAFVGVGDKVLLFEPAYDSYGPAVIVNGGIPIYLKLSLPHFEIPWTDLERTLKEQQIKLMIVNNPHNPAGTTLTKDDLQRMDKLTKAYDCLIIWDEVYDMLVFDGAKHNSALEIASLMEHSVVVYSLGKTLHNTGWKVGYTVAKESISKEIRKLHQFTVFSVNTPAQYAIARFLENHESFFNTLHTFYEAKRDLFIQLLKTSLFDFLPCQGSYFALAKYHKISELSDMEMAHQMVKDYGVAVIPISTFYHDGFDPKILRFCFAKKDETLIQAANKLLNIK